MDMYNLKQAANETSWNEFSKWLTYSDVKKLKEYSENSCHELNAYLKYKDPVFFHKVVEPFLKSKLQKDIVDYCLIKDPNAKSYCFTPAVNKLNPF